MHSRRQKSSIEFHPSSKEDTGHRTADGPTAGRPGRRTTRGGTITPCTEDRDLGLAEDTSHGTRTAYTTTATGESSRSTNPRPFPSPCQSGKDRAARATRAVTGQASGSSPFLLESPRPGTDTLLLRLPRAPRPAHAHPSPVQPEEARSKRHRHAALYSR